jgi:hypothetical protein
VKEFIPDIIWNSRLAEKWHSEAVVGGTRHAHPKQMEWPASTYLGPIPHDFMLDDVSDYASSQTKFLLRLYRIRYKIAPKVVESLNCCIRSEN